MLYVQQLFKTRYLVAQTIKTKFTFEYFILHRLFDLLTNFSIVTAISLVSDILVNICNLNYFISP
jgi:hypothetical protein